MTKRIFPSLFLGVALSMSTAALADDLVLANGRRWDGLAAPAAAEGLGLQGHPCSYTPRTDTESKHFSRQNGGTRS